LLAATVPALQALVDADAKKGAGPRRRVRIGLYSYQDAVSPATAPAAHRTLFPQRGDARRRARRIDDDHRARQPVLVVPHPPRRCCASILLAFVAGCGGVDSGGTVVRR
jgi:hypothetical protein